MNGDRETQERLDHWCDEVVRVMLRAGRSGDGLEGYLEAVPLERKRVRKDCWDFTITTGGPGAWLCITPTRATVMGAWGTARYEERVALKPTLLRRAVDLMVASTALASGLPLSTRDPDDLRGLEDLVEIVDLRA